MGTFLDITVRQREEFDALLAKALTHEDVKRILTNPELASGLVTTLRAELASHAQSTVNWTPVDQYPAKLRVWNTQFGLGLTELQIAEFDSSLPDHAGANKPTGVSLTLGKGLRSDHEIAMQILKYELENLGVSFADRLDITKVSYLPGSEPPGSVGAKIAPALLDIGTFWDPDGGIAPREVVRQRSRWPSHEVALLLALNPHIYRDMDRTTIPFMVAAGLVVATNQVPCFRREANGAYVDGGWDGNPWRSVVAFRER